MSAVDDLAMQILADVVADFRAKNLLSEALHNGYVGVSIVTLELKYCASASHAKVDFDLALKQLEESKLVRTGPMVPYENSPDSRVFAVGSYSKREFVYVTEKGYKAAQKSTAKPRLSSTNIHIGHMENSAFVQGSPFATVNQTFNISSQEFKTFVQNLRELMAGANLSEVQRSEADAQFSSLDLELNSSTPSRGIVRASLQSLRTILENASGSLIGSAAYAALVQYILHIKP
jgi:hypothetical protein